MTRHRLVWPMPMAVTIIVVVALIACAQATQPMDRETRARYDRLIQTKSCQSWLTDPPADCLKPSHGECVSAGCTWIAGYPGPWCQFPIPEQCIPTRWDIIAKYINAEFGHLTSHQYTAAFIAIPLVACTVALMIWADRRQRLQDRSQPKHHSTHNHNHHLAVPKGDQSPTSPRSPRSGDEQEEESVVGTKYASPPPPSSVIGLSTGLRRRAKHDAHDDADERPFSLLAPNARRSKGGQKIAELPWFLTTDTICCVVLFVLSMVIHLWRLEEPPILTYDECHFGYFASKYFKREYLFDIHPPLAKMTFYVLGALLGYDPGPNATFQFKGEMGTAYHNWYQFYPLRFVASTFGALVVPMMYLCCRAVKLSPGSSIIGASLVLWETCLLTESRGILTDSQLIFWNALTIWVMLKLFYTPPENKVAHQRWMYATAFCCGCVFSVKFTALATLGLFGIEAFFGIFLIKKPLTLIQVIVCGLIGFTVMMFWWWCHFAILIYDHSEVLWQDPEFQSSLIGNQYYGKLSPPWFPIKTFQLIITMIQVNAKTLEPHNWSSQWFNWVIGRNTRVASASGPGWEISVFTNPAIITITCVALAVGALLVFLYLRYHIETKGKLGELVKNQSNRELCCLAAFCLIGWLLNLLPYIFVARTTFVYHYLPGLLYAQLLTAILIERGFTYIRYRGRVIVCLLLVGMMALGWWFYSPWIYAFPVSSAQHENRKHLMGGK